MFHRVKIEDQSKEQQQPAKAQQPEQQSFLPRAEEQRPPVQEERPRQRSFIQPSESIVNENARTEPRQEAVRPAHIQQQQSAPVQQVQAEPQPAARKETPVQTQQQPQQSQQKEAKPMTMNTARDNAFDKNEAAQDAEHTQTRPAGIPGGYQAANQPARMPGGYPGAYPGAAAYSVKPATENRAHVNTAASQALTIGRGITLSGEIEACEHLIVEGNVEAALKGAKLLDIAESGTFYGAVEIEKATIAGRFEGDLTVNGRLTVRSTGSITGSISYKELEVESGAVIEGRITAMRAKDDSSRKNSGKEASSKARDFRANAQQEAANNDAGLFGDKTAAE